MWIYPVDMNRANEFGQTFKKDDRENVTLNDNEEEAKYETELPKGIKKRKSKPE